MPNAMDIFYSLREDLAGPELAVLKVSVRTHYERLVRVQERDELVAVDLAELLCVRLEEVLAMAHLLAAEPRAHIVGAARYFISEADAVPDARSCTGLDDDVEVWNYVARALGRPDLVITE